MILNTSSKYLTPTEVYNLSKMNFLDLKMSLDELWLLHTSNIRTAIVRNTCVQGDSFHSRSLITDISSGQFLRLHRIWESDADFDSQTKDVCQVSREKYTKNGLITQYSSLVLNIRHTFKVLRMFSFYEELWHTEESLHCNADGNCNTTFVYRLECECICFYTKHRLCDRLAKHKNAIRTENPNYPMAQHFGKSGHTKPNSFKGDGH